MSLQHESHAHNASCKHSSGEKVVLCLAHAVGAQLRDAVVLRNVSNYGFRVFPKSNLALSLNMYHQFLLLRTLLCQLRSGQGPNFEVH